MQRLASVRDWREALDLQSDYLRESMARMAEGISRQLNLTRTLTHSMLDAGRGNFRTPPDHPPEADAPASASTRCRSSACSAISLASAPIRRRSALRRMKPSASRWIVDCVLLERREGLAVERAR